MRIALLDALVIISGRSSLLHAFILQVPKLREVCTIPSGEEGLLKWTAALTISILQSLGSGATQNGSSAYLTACHINLTGVRSIRKRSIGKLPSFCFPEQNDAFDICQCIWLTGVKKQLIGKENSISDQYYSTHRDFKNDHVLVYFSNLVEANL